MQSFLFVFNKLPGADLWTTKGADTFVPKSLANKLEVRGMGWGGNVVCGRGLVGGGEEGVHVWDGGGGVVWGCGLEGGGGEGEVYGFCGGGWRVI